MTFVTQMMRWSRAFVAATLAGVSLSACGGPTEITVDHAWVRLPAVAGRPAAAYFTVHGGPTNATLIGVTSDVSIRSAMHESMAAGGGASSMKPLASVAIPPASDVAFVPGGRHVMLYDVNPIVKPGSSLLLTLTFSDGSRIVHRASVVGAGDPAVSGL